MESFFRGHLPNAEHIVIQRQKLSQVFMSLKPNGDTISVGPEAPLMGKDLREEATDPVGHSNTQGGGRVQLAERASEGYRN